MQSNVKKTLQILSSDTNLLRCHFCSLKVGTGRFLPSNEVNHYRPLTRRIDCVTQYRLSPTYNGSFLHCSSRLSFWNPFGTKVRKEKENEEETQRKLAEEEEKKKKLEVQINEQINACKSSEALLSTISKHMNDDVFSLYNGMLAVDRLSLLKNKEIVKANPDIPDSTSKVVLGNLHLMKKVKQTFSRIHYDTAFEALIKLLASGINSMDNKQFLSCFASLMGLNVDQYDPSLQPFFIRLHESSHEGFDPSDILKLSFIGDCLQSNTFRAQYVIPKYCHYLKANQDHTDESIFADFLELTNAIGHVVVNEYRSPIINIMYKSCKETSCLKDLDCVTKLQRVIRKYFLISKAQNRKRGELIENGDHQDIIVQEMKELCEAKLLVQGGMLTPYQMITVTHPDDKTMPKLQQLLISRGTFLLNNHLNKLSTPEIIWILLALKTPEVNNQQLNGVKTETLNMIRQRFNSLNVPNLLRIYRGTHNFKIFNEFKLLPVILQRSLVNIDDILANNTLKIYFLLFKWRSDELCSNENSAVNNKLEKRIRDDHFSMRRKNTSVSNALNQYNNRYMLFSLSHILSLHYVAPSTYDILLPVVESDKNAFRRLTSWNQSQVIWFTLDQHLCPGSTMHQSFSSEEMCVYRQFMFNVLTKSLTVFGKLKNSVNPYKVLNTLVRVANHQKLDCILGRKFADSLEEVAGPNSFNSQSFTCVMDLLTTNFDDLQIAAVRTKIIEILEKIILFNQKKTNQPTGNPPTDWWLRKLKLLFKLGYEVKKGSRMEYTLINLLQKTCYNPSISTPEILLYCCLLNVPASNYVDSFFTSSFLQQIQKIYQECDMLQRDSMRRHIFYLNQEAYIRYPKRQKLWLHTENEAETFTKINDSESSVLTELSNMIDNIAGGSEFVGRQCYLDYSIPLWRVIFLDDHNKPVPYCVNMEQLITEQHCAGLKKVVFMYVDKMIEQNLMQKRYSEYLSKIGWKVIQIHPFEWNSISLATREEKCEFLQDKIFSDQPSIERPTLPRTNTEDVNVEWRTALKLGYKQYG